MLHTNDVQISAIPRFTRRYYHSAAQAYNMARYLVERLKLDKVVFATAMSYWHEFAQEYGERHMNAIVLAAAAVFLAGKVEHYKMRVDDILRLAFEISVKRNDNKVSKISTANCETNDTQYAKTQGNNNGKLELNKDEPIADAKDHKIMIDNIVEQSKNKQSDNMECRESSAVEATKSNHPGELKLSNMFSAVTNNSNIDNDTNGDDDIESWRRMILQAELVLCDALHFDFQRTHPIQEIKCVLSAYFHEIDSGDEKTSNNKSNRTSNMEHNYKTKNEEDNQSMDNRSGAVKSTEQRLEMQKELESIATRLYILSLITPLYVQLSGSAVIRTIVYTTLIYAGGKGQEHINSDNYHINDILNGDDAAVCANSVWNTFPLPQNELRRAIMHTLFDALDFMGKKTGLYLLDEQISRHRKQEQIASPLGFVSSVSFNSSSSPPQLPFTNNETTT